jgi:hypothetical protein
MTYEPKYSIPSGATPVKTSLTPVTINGKTLTGYQTTFSDGTSKWIRYEDAALSSNFDYSTFTGTKKSDGTWTWSGTTDKSISNLAGATGLTEQQINDGLYKTPTLQNTLNGVRVQQLGGTQAAQKVDSSIPQSSGTSVNPNGPVNQGSTATPVSQTQALSDKDIQYGDVRTDYAQLLTYPITRNPKQDYIKFSMFKYSSRQVISDELGGREQRTPIGNVALPIQPTIADSNVVSWGEDRLNALQETGAKMSLQLMGGDVAGATNTAETALTDNAGAIKTQAVSALAAAAVGTNANLFTRLTGAIVNPNLELLFQGPSLRTFSFTFSMSARDKDEAIQIKKIIRFFKQGMSVKRASASLYLKSPHTFGISYIYGETNADHPWINKIKECALTNCSVNYTPAGNYATYADGSMTQYDLTLNFNELDPIYDDDYPKDNDATIGY